MKWCLYIARVGTTVIVIANQKGGVGKTTTAVNVAACLAEAGQPVLLIDLDSQANATSGLGLEKKPGTSVYQSLLGESQLSERIQKTDYPGLDIIPSEMDLCGAEVELNGAPDHLLRLKKALQPVRESARYPVILIDCPPSLSLLTLNSFAAADRLLVPLQSEYFALEGIATINQITKQVQESGANPDLQLIGVLMTMFDSRLKLAQQVVDEVRQFFGDLVFATVIPRTTRLAEAPSYGQPIIHYDPYSAGTSAYRLLTAELQSRINAIP